MKGLTLGLASLLLGILMLFAPPAAHAQDPVDCSSGCVIVTCNAATCTVWSCDQSGCSIIGHYYPKNSGRQARVKAEAKAPRPFDAVCREGEHCAVKTCAHGSCEVRLFDGTAFVPVATVRDVGAVVDAAARGLAREH